MKRVVLCSVIITFIMIISLSGTFIVRNSCRDMKEECEKVIENYKNGEKVYNDMDGANSLFEFERLWMQDIDEKKAGKIE